MMNRVEMNEAMMEQVNGGLSPEDRKGLLDKRAHYTEMWRNGEISHEIYLKQVGDIDNQLRTPESVHFGFPIIEEDISDL